MYYSMGAESSNRDVRNFENFGQLNGYLEDVCSSLRGEEKRSIPLEEIKKVMLSNLSLVNGNSTDESIKFIKNVRLITTELGEGSESSRGLFESAARAVATTANHLKSIEKYRRFDEDLYYQTLSIHISNQKRLIKEFHLSRKEMLGVASRLTYLDLTDATTNDFVDNTLDEEFIRKILKRAKNLDTLIIKNSKIHGRVAFLDFEGWENLRHLKISNCPFFDHYFERMENLEDLEIEGCPSFDQCLEEMPNLKKLTLKNCLCLNTCPKGLHNLEDLEIEGCFSFDQCLEGMPNLKKLLLKDCSHLNTCPIGLHNLVDLIIDNCDSLNTCLEDMPHLKSLIVKNCKNYDTSPKGMQNLLSLKLEQCYSYNQPFAGVEMPNLKKLDLSNCGSYDQPIDLPSLQNLYLWSCYVFNNTIAGPNLETLVLRGCNIYHQAIEVPSLLQLILEDCFSFDNTLKGSVNLQRLSMWNCSRYEGDLEGMQNLQQVVIGYNPYAEQSLARMMHVDLWEIYGMDILIGDKNFDESTLESWKWTHWGSYIKKHELEQAGKKKPQRDRVGVTVQ